MNFEIMWIISIKIRKVRYGHSHIQYRTVPYQTVRRTVPYSRTVLMLSRFHIRDSLDQIDSVLSFKSNIGKNLFLHDSARQRG